MKHDIETGTMWGLIGQETLSSGHRKSLDFDFKVQLESMLSHAFSNLGLGYLVT